MSPTYRTLVRQAEHSTFPLCGRLTVSPPPPMETLRPSQRPIGARSGKVPTNTRLAATVSTNQEANICRGDLRSHHCKHHMSFIKLYSRLFTPLGLQVFLCLVWRAEQHSQPDSSSLATHKMVGWRILYWPGPGREPGMFSN